MKPYVEILENIRNTRCRLEEVPQSEYKEISHGICHGHIKVVEGYLFLTPLGVSIICDFYRRKMEIEKDEEKPSVVKQNFERFEVECFKRESFGLAFWIMFGLILFMCFIVVIASC